MDSIEFGESLLDYSPYVQKKKDEGWREGFIEGFAESFVKSFKMNTEDSAKHFAESFTTSFTESLAEWEAKRVQHLQEEVVDIIKTRFPSLTEPTKDNLTLFREIGLLDYLVDRLSAAPDETTARFLLYIKAD